MNRAIRFRRARGFTLLELVVVVTIIALLATALGKRVLFYQERAERAAMVEVASALQSALIMRYGHLVIDNSRSDVARLATENPMTWLAKVPRNYAGEFYDPLPDAVEPGSWMFDQKTHELVFVLNHADNFVPGPDGHNWIRYHTRLMYDPPNPNAGGRVLVGVLFEPVTPFQWAE